MKNRPDQIFNRDDFDKLATLFDPEARYAGYRPTVRERPAGDARTDTEKRFLHIGLKYNPEDWALEYLHRAHAYAWAAAEERGCPAVALPSIENGTLRVLYYPQGAGGVEHCDFDLITLNCWRDPIEGVEAFDADGWTPAYKRVHYGELARIYGWLPETPHRIVPMQTEQRSIVYFASPAMATPLPKPYTFPAIEGFSEKTVTTSGEWQIERTNRSRVIK